MNKTKLKNNSAIKQYSPVAAWIMFAFSFYGMLISYFYSSLIWIFLGVCLMITFLTLVVGIKSVIQLVNFPFISPKYQKLAINLLSFGNFVSSIYGLISLMIVLPIKDKSIVLLPVIAISFIFAGSTIGLFKYSNTRIN